MEKKEINKILLIISIIITIALIIIFLITNDEKSEPSLINFKEDQNLEGIYHGYVLKEIDVEMSKISLSIFDHSLNSAGSSEPLKDGITIYTENWNNTLYKQGLNCTFFDKNKNNMLDYEDEFIIKNVEKGDSIQLVKNNGNLLYSYKFH